MEFAVYGLLAAYLLRRALDGSSALSGWFVQTPLDKPLKFLALCMPLFGCYGLILGNPAQDAFGYYEWRCLFLAIVFFFLLTSILTTRQKALDFVQWFLILDTLIALFQLALYFLRIQGPLPLVLGTGPVGEGPENYMFAFASLAAISWLLFAGKESNGKRAFMYLAALAPLLNIALSEKRTAQLGFVVGMAVLIWRIPPKRRIRLVTGLMGGLAAVVLLVSAFGFRTAGGGLGKSASRYVEVIQLVKNPAQVTSIAGETVLFHVFDLVDSFNSIRLRPILGYGFGGMFVRDYTGMVGGADIQPGIVHDQYLDFWLKMGLVGLAAFLWLLVSFFRSARSAIPKVPAGEYDSIALGLYAAVWGDIAVELWGPGWIGNTKMPIVIMMSFALVICLLRKRTLTRDRNALA